MGWMRRCSCIWKAWKEVGAVHHDDVGCFCCFFLLGGSALLSLCFELVFRSRRLGKNIFPLHRRRLSNLCFSHSVRQTPIFLGFVYFFIRFVLLERLSSIGLGRACS